MSAITVIVPVYNVEKYIERCARSLFEQSFEDMEFIFVDDCSNDDSISIVKSVLENYPNRRKQVKFLVHEENKGLTSTRNTGLAASTGEYVAHCDSDDWVDSTMYENLYNCAKETNADAVYCDINMVFNDSIIIYKAAQYTCDKKNFLCNYIVSIWTSVCNILVKKDIYKQNNLSSPVHLSYCEDFWLSFRLFYFANKISYVDKALYNYNRSNETSIMHSLNYKTESDERKAYLETIDFLKKMCVWHLYEKQMSWRVIKSTHDSIYHGERYKEFLNIYPDSHRYILTCPYINIKTKLLLWMFAHKMKFLALSLIRIRSFLLK